MTFYARNGNIITVTENKEVDMHEKLPVGTYTIIQHPMTGAYMLQEVQGYNLGKIYGNVEKVTNRILSTFVNREHGTGALLVGEKGSGKTLQSKHISVEARKQGISTILITQPYCGDGFNKFIQKIEEPTVIIFDEYEKVYHDEENQNALLTLLDGVYPTKKLFIFTSNDRYGVNKYMMNRPGRLFYCLEYKGLDSKFIEEYADDVLKNKEHKEGLMKVCGLFDSINFDMLKGLVEEMNRYGETAMESMELLNCQFDTYNMDFKVTLIEDGKQTKIKSGHDNIRVNPLKPFEFSYRVTNDDGTTGEYYEIDVNPEECVSIKDNVYTFKMDEDKITLILKKKDPYVFDYSRYVDMAI